MSEEEEPWWRQFSEFFKE